MPQRPRIALPIPTSKDFEYNRRCWRDYANAIDWAGGEAIEIPLSLPHAEVANLSRSCVGIVLPGSPADVDPRRYGQEAVPGCAPADPPREAVDLFLLEEAALRRMPVLAICFGAQILNVSRGGTLLQDLTVLPVNHAAGPSVAEAHSVEIASGSLLGSMLLDRDLAVPVGRLSAGVLVNSSHHQAAGIPGEGLRVVARCPQDGVIEALEGGSEEFLVAVQWHPERNFVRSHLSQSLFTRLLRAAGGCAV